MAPLKIELQLLRRRRRRRRILFINGLRAQREQQADIIDFID